MLATLGRVVSASPLPHPHTLDCWSEEVVTCHINKGGENGPHHVGGAARKVAVAASSAAEAPRLMYARGQQ